MGARVLPNGTCLISRGYKTHDYTTATLESWDLNAYEAIFRVEPCSCGSAGGPQSGVLDAVGGSQQISALQRRRLEDSKLDSYRKKARRSAEMDGLRPRLLHPVNIEFPASPENFRVSGLQPIDVLQYIHAHRRDFRVRFQPENHVYFIDGRESNGSVTGMIHFFCKEFDSDAVITSMMNGPHWPRAGYLRDLLPASSFARVAAVAPELIDLYVLQPKDELRICHVLQNLCQQALLKDDVAEFCLSRQEIKQQSVRNGAEAAHYGTWMHALFEAYLNGHEVPTTSPEFRMFHDFLSDLGSDIVAWRTEWVIFAEDEHLAGSIDFCARASDGKFLLIDWKRTAGLRAKFQSWERMQAPLSHVCDCPGMQYRLQLNAYRYVLEKYYDMAISRMLIVCCHPDNGQVALVDEVGRLEPETEGMMARWRDARGGSAGDFSDNLSSASTCSEFVDLIRESWWESISVDDAGDADVDLVHDRIAQLRDIVLRHAGRLISSPELWRFVPSPLILLDNAPAWNTRFCLCARRLRVMSRLPVSMQSHVLERHTKRVQAHYNALRDWADVLVFRPEVAEDFPSPLCLQVTRRAWEATMYRARVIVDQQRKSPHPARKSTVVAENESCLRDKLGGSVLPQILQEPPLQLQLQIGDCFHCQTDRTGGAMPLDVLDRLPSYYFEWTYLRNLAATSRRMLASVRNSGHWAGSDLDVTTPELENRRRLLDMSGLWERCRNLYLSMPQMAMLVRIPDQARLMWDFGQVVRLPVQRNPFIAVQSLQPLMGGAVFDLRVSTSVRGLYIRVRECGGDAHANIRVENLHTSRIAWSYGFNGSPFVPHQSASRHSIRANAPNIFKLQWSQRSFRVYLNGEPVSACRLRPEAADLTPPLAKLYIWGFCPNPGQQGQDIQVHSLPSPILLNARIRCAICEREHSLLLPRWCVCPFCCTWVCGDHVRRTPWRLCPRCVMQLGDYVGGSSSAPSGDVIGGASAASTDRVPAENARAVEEADGLLPRGFARNLLEASQATLDSEFPGDAAIGNVSPCALGGPAGLTQELEDAIDGDAEDDAVLTRARKRALLPGADATMPNFANSFQSCKNAATASLQNAIGLQPDSEMSILQQVQLIRSNILTKVPDLPDDIVRLITGATAVYRMRLSDMHIREQVLLLWIVEGGDHMRCHSGNLYFYASGAFSLHRGIPPQGTLARCKRFLLNLEGMFRMLPSNRLQNNSELLDSVLEIFDQHNQSAKSFLSACERAAQSGKSSNAHRRRPAFDEEEQAGAEAELSAGHTILADALTKVGFSMQRQLLEDKIFNLVVEWCDTAQEKQPGVSYKDCTVLYDQGPDQNVKFVPGSPTNNLYLHVPHALCDPVQDAAHDRLTKFYSQTLWLNNDVPCMHQTWAAGASLALEALLNKQICDMACF